MKTGLALIVLVIATVYTQVECVHWALLVAGSNTWNNYRHQADVCHAYQILRRYGFPAERIVTMMYDDIAYHPMNPTKGVILNHPRGNNVYDGVVIDYKGDDVSPENFIAALTGDEAAVKGIGSGKVIKSGPKDNIFVYYADHGASGMIAFPNWNSLSSRHLVDSIQKMYERRRYAKMVLYIEACHSGSMFDDILSKNINVFASTASNPEESSYSCYWDNRRQTFLGDLYSVKWMEDSDKGNVLTETLLQQFEIVKRQTTLSHVCKYGDMKLLNNTLGEFQGDRAGALRAQPEPIFVPDVPLDAVPSDMVPLSILYHRLIDAKEQEKQQSIKEEIVVLLQSESEVDERMKLIVSRSVPSGRRFSLISGQVQRKLRNFDCYEQAVEIFNERCYNIGQNDYARSRLQVLVNLCEENVPLEKIKQAITEVCA